MDKVEKEILKGLLAQKGMTPADFAKKNWKYYRDLLLDQQTNNPDYKELLGFIEQLEATKIKQEALAAFLKEKEAPHIYEKEGGNNA